jgi:hypothetical protein
MPTLGLSLIRWKDDILKCNLKKYAVEVRPLLNCRILVTQASQSSDGMITECDRHLPADIDADH